MRTTNQLQKKDKEMNPVRKEAGKAENTKAEIYRMMLFLNLINDKSLYRPDIPIISEDDKPGKETDPFQKLPEVYPRIVCSN